MVLQEAVTRLSPERYKAQEVSGEEKYGLIKPPLSNRIANAGQEKKTIPTIPITETRETRVEHKEESNGSHSVEEKR